MGDRLPGSQCVSNGCSNDTGTLTLSRNPSPGTLTWDYRPKRLHKYLLQSLRLSSSADLRLSPEVFVKLFPTEGDGDRFLLNVPPPDIHDEATQSSLVTWAGGWQGTFHLLRRAPFEHSAQVQLTLGDGDFQGLFQFSVNLTTGDVQGLAGAQWQSKKLTLLKTAHLVMTASAFVQLLAGITNVGGTSANGTLTGQAMAGGQMNIIVGNINATIQLGVQATQQGKATDLSLTPSGQANDTGPSPFGAKLTIHFP